MIDLIAQAQDRFAATTTQHAMTILRDDGVYRHLRFAPGGQLAAYWYDLVTWPKHLVITGDMGTFMFARQHDMFTWFRQDLAVNAGYWAEKLQAGEAFQWSEDQFAEWVAEQVAAGKEAKPELEWDWIDAEIDACVMPPVVCSQHDAVAAIQDWNDWKESLCGFRFETDDCDWDDFRSDYLWCCHAIKTGIARYDAWNGQSER